MCVREVQYYFLFFFGAEKNKATLFFEPTDRTMATKRPRVKKEPTRNIGPKKKARSSGRDSNDPDQKKERKNRPQTPALKVKRLCMLSPACHPKNWLSASGEGRQKEDKVVGHFLYTCGVGERRQGGSN
jgi:hypothetical protein